MVERKSLNNTNFTFGWMNGKSNLSISKQSDGAFIKIDDTNNQDYLYFYINLDKKNMIYTITHPMYFKTPYGNMYVTMDVGVYDTFNGEKIKNREYGIRKVILDWFVAMYGTEKFASAYLGEDYKHLNYECTEDYNQKSDETNKFAQQAVKKFREGFCLD